MKTNLILICFAFLLISCLPDNEEEALIGIKIGIINSTNLEYSNVKVTIGGLQDGEFIGTTSYTLPTIRVQNNNYEVQYATTDYNRWQPDFNLVKAISDKAYFTVQLNGEDPVLLYDAFDSAILINVQITENGIVKDNYGGNLDINIYDDSIKWLFFDQE